MARDANPLKGWHPYPYQQPKILNNDQVNNALRATHRPGSFEDYHANTHTPVALKMAGYSEFEDTKFLSAPDGG